MHKETDQRIRCDHHRDGVRADEFVSTSVLRGSTQSRCGTTTFADSQPRCANLCEKFGLALRRHDQWLAPATTPRDLGAAAELQLLRQADPDTGQPLLVALDGHTLRREIWVCLCVQRRLVCSAGIKPAGAKVRRPVAWMAGWRETETLKPIDKVSLGEIASHRAVMRVNAKWPRKQMNPGAEPANEGRRQHGVPKSDRCGILISAG